MDAVANYWSDLCIETAVGQIEQYWSKLVFTFLLLPHCVKSTQIRGYFWPVFSCNRTEYGPEITLDLTSFHAVSHSEFQCKVTGKTNKKVLGWKSQSNRRSLTKKSQKALFENRIQKLSNVTKKN